MITVNSSADVHNINNRYAIVKDTFGVYRVISLMTNPPRELASKIDTYFTYALTVGYSMRAPTDWSRPQRFNQQQLADLIAYWQQDTVTAASQKEAQQLVNKLVAKCVIFVCTKVPGQSEQQSDQHQPANVPTGRCMPVSVLALDPQAGGWVIATVSDKGLLFSSKPKVHTDLVSAETELKRLAQLQPGTEFVLFKAVQSVVVDAMKTKTFA